MEKKRYINLIIILAIIIFAIIFLTTKSPPETDEEIVKCIGENSILYIQIGCHYCDQQEELFGKNLKYINTFLCNSNEWKTCTELGLEGTPSWKINNEIYSGVKSIEKLRELTSC